MASIPVAQSSPSLAPLPNAYQRSNVTADNFGAQDGRQVAQAGAQLGQTGDLMARTALTIQDEDNTREAKRLDVEFSKSLRDITYGDGQNQGYFSKNGEDALTGFDPAKKAVEEARRRVSEGTTNPRVRDMFDAASNARVERELDTMTRHVSQQRKIASDAVDESRLGEASDDGAAAWNDPKIIARSQAIISSTVADLAQRNGWAPEVAASKMQEAQTVLHRKVIDAALQRDPAAAQAYYEANKDKIDGRARADIEKSLETGTLRQQSQSETARIMAAYPGNEKAALDEARKIKDPKQQDEVVERVGKQFAEKRRIDDEGRRTARENAWSSIIKGGSVDNLPPSVLASMDGTAVAAMLSFERKRAENGRGFATASDPVTYNSLHKLQMEDPVAFADHDIMGDINKLDEGDFKYWQAQQRAVSKADVKEQAKNANYTLGERIGKEFMNAAKIDPTPKPGAPDAPKVEAINRAIRTMVDEAHAAGKKATQEDIHKGLSELFLSGEIDSHSMWSNSPNRSFFQVKGTPEEGDFVLLDVPGQRARISEVTGVPQGEVEAIAKALTDKKRPVTAANIKRAWESVNAR